MNERIRELAEQAGEYAMAVHDGHIVPPLDKEALAQPEQEPVAKPKLIGWRTENFLWETADIKKAQNWEPNIGVLPIFEGDPNTQLTTPPQRKPLTDEEIKMMIPDGQEWKYGVGFSEAIEFARAIEAAHGIKEKNT